MTNSVPRENRLVILLRDEEREMLDNWANDRHLPTSTLARQILLDAVTRTLVDPSPAYQTERRE